MTYIRFGNVKPADFAERVGAEFTESEMNILTQRWSNYATLRFPEEFHIFDDPALVVAVGDEDSEVVRILKEANERKTFNTEVNIVKVDTMYTNGSLVPAGWTNAGYTTDDDW